MDSLYSRHGVIYVTFYEIPRISGNFDACADSSVYQALFPRKKVSLGSRL